MGQISVFHIRVFCFPNALFASASDSFRIVSNTPVLFAEPHMNPWIADVRRHTCIYLFIYQSVCLSVCLSVCMYVCLFVSLFILINFDQSGVLSMHLQKIAKRSRR